MSDILLTWLNTEVDMSKKISDMERDFSNGYLLAELLYKFNQLTNFRDFLDENGRMAKINNFTLLQQILKNIGVNFNMNVAKQIMDGTKGVVLKLLYQIRSKLEKKGVNAENMSLKKSNHLAELYSSMKFRKEIPQFDRFTKQFFYNQLQAMTKSQMEVNLDRHLHKFEKFRKQQDEVIHGLKEFDEIKNKIEVEERVKQMKSDGARYRSFQQQFEQKGIDDWKNNLLRMKEIQKRDLDFQLNEAEKYKTLVFNSIKQSEHDYLKKIDTFEKNLKSDSGENNRNISLDFIDTKRNFKSASDFSNKLRDTITQKIMNDQTTKKERDRRRRKIIVEQSKAQLEIENRRREEQYIQKLYKHSNQERQLTYETFRVIQIKNVIIENRKLRDEMYFERREMDIKFLEKNEEEFLKFNKEIFETELEKDEYRKRDLEIALKQKTRSKNTNKCNHIIDLIIDIAEEAYIYQQTNDSEEIDLRVWREWTQIFISNQSVQNRDILLQLEKENLNTEQMAPIQDLSQNNRPPSQQPSKGKDSMVMDNFLNANMMSNYNTKYGNTFYSNYTQEPNYSLIDKTLDDCEFIDYVNYLGQWCKDIIPQNAFVQLNLNELMFDMPNVEKTDPKAPATKKVVPAKDKKGEEEFKEDDLENLIIPRDTLKNNFLGDLIEILVDMKYSEDESTIKTNMNIFNQIPIKLSLIGQDFAGKKTQAKILSENFPFKIYIVEKLLANALDLLERLEKPVDISNVEYKMMRTKQKDQMHHERAKEEAKYSRIKDIARDIKDILRNGNAITDDIYVDLIVEYIKIDFAEINEEEMLDQIFRRVKEKEEVLEEIERNNEEKTKRPKAFNKHEQELNQKLMRISLEASKGFVIVNFPNTYNQAKLLEKKISQYIPDNEKPITQGNLLKESFALILDRSAKISPVKKLISAGLDYIFWLDVAPSECIRRAVGRRVLPKEIRQEDEKVMRSSDHSYKHKFEDHAPVSIYHLEDNLPSINSDICEKLIRIDDPQNSESSLVTRHLSFDNMISSIVDFYQPFGNEKRKLKMFNKIDGNKIKDLVTNDLIEYLNQLVVINEEKEIEIVKAEEHTVSNIGISLEKNENVLNSAINISNNIMVNNNMSSDDRILDSINNNLALNNNNEDNINNEKDDEYSLYIQKINNIKSMLSKDLSEILLKIWSRVFENYVKECKSIFKFIRLQRDAIGVNYNHIGQKFIEFLKRPSKKQTLLLDFQLKYNKFKDEYPDLIDDPQVKEEHHQEVDDLNDRIFEIIEARKTEAIDERKKIMSACWIENEMEKFYLNLERLYQAEIDKFIGSLHIIKDYYHNLDSRPLVEIPFQSLDILKEESDPTLLESEDILIFPKIEKLHKIALRVQFQYDEALNSAEKKRLEKLLEGKKKDVKPVAGAGAKKNIPAESTAILEEKKEVYQFEEEMKKVIKTEKAKYRFRITLLKYWGMNCLKGLRKLANTIYSKLDDWIILSIKAENEALMQLISILKNAIEKEERIKYELELDTFDVIVNMDVQNFIELPPKPKPAKEIIDHNKFNINQLKIIMNEFKTYEIDGEFLRTSTFIDIFVKKYISSKNDNDVYYGIPGLLKNLSFHNFYKFIKHLDPNCTDMINIRFIGTYFCLLDSKVMVHLDETNFLNHSRKITNLFEDDRITKEQFINMPMWFDDDEGSTTLNMYEDYERAKKLKEVIFEINKEDELISLNDLLKIFNLKVLQMDCEKFKFKTYFVTLFN